MVEFLVPLAGVIATFLSATIIIYVFLMTRNKERLALIARDKDASIFKDKRSSKHGFFRFGILLIFFGGGALVGMVLVRLGILTEEMVVLGLCPICLGFGLIVAQRMIEEKEEDLEV